MDATTNTTDTTTENYWPHLGVELAQYSEIYEKGINDLIDSFADLVDSANTNGIPRVLLLRTFYAAITDLNRQLEQEAENLVEDGNATTSTFKNLPLESYFLYGGSPCYKTSNDYELGHNNTIDLLTRRPFGLPAGTKVLLAKGELEDCLVRPPFGYS